MKLKQNWNIKKREFYRENNLKNKMREEKGK